MNNLDDNKKKPGLLRRFFGFIGATITWLRNTLLNLIFFIVVILIFSLFAAVGQQETKPLPEQAPLVLAPSGFLVDQLEYIDPVSKLIEPEDSRPMETLVREQIEMIDHAASDARITALVLNLDYLVGGGLSKLEELGLAIERFKASGKPVIAIGDHYSQEQYYLASFADEIYLHPMGAVFLTGYSSYRNYLKDALDKLNINYHIFKVGTFKDAVEPFMRNDMSEASKEHNSLWLSDLWSQYKARVANLRGITPEDIDIYINRVDVALDMYKGDSALLAKERGLVDDILPRVKVRALLEERFGRDEDINSFVRISANQYRKHIYQTPKAQQVGLIVASGTILDGAQPAGSIGGDSLAALIRQARNNDSIKALVLRVDSGGGSAFASEIIREELAQTREAGIPVVVSMGSVAASGGYWIATASDEIWATPATITGSIGVFGAFPTLENAFTHLGIHTDGVGTTALAGSMRLDRALSPIAKNAIQRGVEHTYDEFLKRVAEARESTPQAVDKIAQGRVWSGSKALELGLIDQLGYLNDALASAAQLAELDDYSVELIRPELSPFEQFMEQIAAEQASVLAPTSLVGQWLPTTMVEAYRPVLDSVHALNAMNDPRAIYAQCLDCTVQ